jgi:hypothetical protein
MAETRLRATERDRRDAWVQRIVGAFEYGGLIPERGLGFGQPNGNLLDPPRQLT